MNHSFEDVSVKYNVNQIESLRECWKSPSVDILTTITIWPHSQFDRNQWGITRKVGDTHIRSHISHPSFLSLISTYSHILVVGCSTTWCCTQCYHDLQGATYVRDNVNYLIPWGQQRYFLILLLQCSIHDLILNRNKLFNWIGVTRINNNNTISWEIICLCICL